MRIIVPERAALGAAVASGILGASWSGACAQTSDVEEQPHADQADPGLQHGLDEGLGIENDRADPIEFASDPEPGSKRWEFRAEALAWFVAPGGDITVPGATMPGRSFSVDDELNIDEPGFAPLIELHARRGRWRITASGYYLDTDGIMAAPSGGSIGDAVVGAGDSISTELDQASFQVAGAYMFEPYRARRNEDGSYDFVAMLEIIGGGRAHYVDLDFAITDANGSVSTVGVDELFPEPFGGVKGTLEIEQRFTLETEITFGGFTTGGDRSSFSADIIASATWRPIRNVGVQFGFRQIFFNLQNEQGAGEFEFDGANGGIFAGIELRH